MGSNPLGDATNNINGLRGIVNPFFIPKKSISIPISNLGDKNQGKKRYFIAKKNPGSKDLAGIVYPTLVFNVKRCGVSKG
jgi:hypothetical protein